MRVLLDACVLVPTLTRALVMTVAQVGAFTPLWSPKILAEWTHAAARSGPLEALAVSSEIARLSARFPQANVTPAPGLSDSLLLPDADDTHVLAAAITGRADHLVTFNLRDFPPRNLAAHNITRTSPDALLLLFGTDRQTRPLVQAELDRAQAATGLPPRALLKKSQLPRFAKAFLI